jgi:hypothetical protein
MIRWLTLVLHLAVAGLKSHRNLLLEILALRHQLLVETGQPLKNRRLELELCASWVGQRQRKKEECGRLRTTGPMITGLQDHEAEVRPGLSLTNTV